MDSAKIVLSRWRMEGYQGTTKSNQAIQKPMQERNSSSKKIKPRQDKSSYTKSRLEQKKNRASTFT